MIEKIKRILNINDTSKDAILNDLISIYSNAINLYCNTLILPIELEFVVIESVVGRYNILGSEGVKSESVEGASYTYQEEMISLYQVYLDKYKKKTSSFRMF